MNRIFDHNKILNAEGEMGPRPVSRTRIHRLTDETDIVSTRPEIVIQSKHFVISTFFCCMFCVLHNTPSTAPRFEALGCKSGLARVYVYLTVIKLEKL